MRHRFLSIPAAYGRRAGSPSADTADPRRRSLCGGSCVGRDGASFPGFEKLGEVLHIALVHGDEFRNSDPESL